jgi:ubiquinone biosynthesis protein UbiJ
MEQQQLSDNRETTLLLASVMDRLAVVDHLAAMITDLEQRLCRLERGRD